MKHFEDYIVNEKKIKIDSNYVLTDRNIKNYNEIFFIRTIIGDLYEGEHHEIVGSKNWDTLISGSLWDRIDRVYWYVRNSIAMDNNISPESVEMDNILLPLNKEVFKKVKQYYKKIVTRY